MHLIPWTGVLDARDRILAPHDSNSRDRISFSCQAGWNRQAFLDADESGLYGDAESSLTPDDL